VGTHRPRNHPPATSRTARGPIRVGVLPVRSVWSSQRLDAPFKGITALHPSVPNGHDSVGCLVTLGKLPGCPPKDFRRAEAGIRKVQGRAEGGIGPCPGEHGSALPRPTLLGCPRLGAATGKYSSCRILQLLPNTCWAMKSPRIQYIKFNNLL
jgi:hypothetical protein